MKLLFINVLLIGVFIWRLLASKGKYLPFLLPDNMGLMDRPVRPPSSSGLSDFAWTMIHITFDSILAILGKIILIPFATGTLGTRIRFGFLPSEPTFRVPTQSVFVERLNKLMPAERILEMQNQTLRAVDLQFIRTHPVDFLNDGIWVVDYAPGRDARKMLAKREITEEDLALSVWKLDGEMKWGVWRVPVAY